jgi:CTP:molybdopterin cytidylyltransferase MocA/NifU-like protein involved in Fe-S cluster formation
MDSYSSVVLEHFHHPLNRGRLENANASAEGSNPLCGDRIRIECEVEAGRVEDAAFTGDACAICIAAASMLSERVKGLTVQIAMLLGDQQLVDWLEGPVPPARRRCATLPLETLHRALLALVPPTPVRPVILAAGGGRRFGGDKLTAMVDGEPMLRGVVRAYAALCGRVTVVARSQSQFETTLHDLPVTVVANPDADEGIASSIRAAVSSCSDRPAVMIALADEPRVDRTLVVAVLNRWQETAAPVVAPRFAGIVGHPVVFDRSCFADLLALDGDTGARGVIRKMGDAVQYVDVDRTPPVDIDTPDDLGRL